MTREGGAPPGLFQELGRILTHSGIYGIGSVIGKLVGFLMVPVYTRFLDPTAYGIVELLDLTLAVGGLILYDLVIEALFRFYYADEDPERRRALVSTALWTHIGLAACGVVVALAAAEPLSRAILGTPTYAPYLRVSLLTFVFMQVNAIPLGYLRVRQRSALYSIATLTSLTLGLTLNIVFIVVLRMGVWGVLLSNLVANAVMAAWLLPMTARQVGFTIRVPMVREMFRYGAPLIPAGMGNFSLNYANRLILNLYAALADVGLFALGAKFSFMMSVLIIQPFLNIWDAKMFEIASRPDAGRIYARVCTYSVFVTVFAGLGLSLLIPDVLSWLVPPSFAGAAVVVPALCLGYVFQLFYYNFYVGLLLHNRTAQLAGVVVGSAAAGILLNFALIPAFGIRGAAWSMPASYAVLAGLCFLASRRTHRVAYEWGRLAKMGGLAVILFAAGSAVPPGAGWIGPAARTVALALFPILLYALRFFDEEELERLRSLVARLLRRKVSAGA